MNRTQLGKYRNFDLWWTEYYDSEGMVGQISAYWDGEPRFAVEEVGMDLLHSDYLISRIIKGINYFVERNQTILC